MIDRRKTSERTINLSATMPLGLPSPSKIERFSAAC